jgi:hypothetical protein
MLMRLKKLLRNLGITVKAPFLDIAWKPDAEIIRSAKSWVSMNEGAVPESAEAAGYEANGTPLHIARARHMGGLHIGKVRAEFKAANIPYDGKEIQVKFYEVYVGPLKWLRESDGKIPTGAIVAGREADGSPLYVARAEYKGGLHIGKVRPGFSSSKIPYGGDEVDVNPYEVLVSD